MKAAVLSQVGSKLEIQQIAIDRPHRREVLIRTAACGICHSDLHFVEGLYPSRTPCVLGHEAAGIVEAVGEDVDYVAPGDPVITCLSVFCGKCEYCLTGHQSLCGGRSTDRRDDEPPRLSRDGEVVHQFAHVSGFAEQMLVHENAVVKIREDMPLDRAALIGCGVTTGVGAVFHTAKVEPGSTVGVIGCGGIGLSAINGAALAGASRIVAIDRIASKLDLAREFGATDTINASDGDPVAQVKELTGGGVRYSFEAIGLKKTCEQAFAMLRAGGTATVIGMVPLGQNLEIPGSALLQEKKLQGSAMGSNRFRFDMPRFIDFYLAGKLNLDRMISSRIPLEEINAGLDALKTGEVARQVIVFDS